MVLFYHLVHLPMKTKLKSIKILTTLPFLETIKRHHFVNAINVYDHCFVFFLFFKSALQISVHARNHLAQRNKYSLVDVDDRIFITICLNVKWNIDVYYIPSSEILEFPSVINFDIIYSDDINFHFLP